MGCHTCGEFLGGWAAKKVQADVVTHDSREKLRVAAAAVEGMFHRVVLGRLDRGPGGSPKRVHFGPLVENLSDVTALFQDQSLAGHHSRCSPRGVLDRWSVA